MEQNTYSLLSILNNFNININIKCRETHVCDVLIFVTRIAINL